MDWQTYIGSDKDVMMGKPVVKGTRITVEHVVSLFAQGWSEAEILDNFPGLSKGSLQAIFAYLEDCMRDGLLFKPTRKSA